VRIRSIALFAIAGALLSACGGGISSTPAGPKPAAIPLVRPNAAGYATVSQFAGTTQGFYPYGGVLVTHASAAVQTLYGTTESGGDKKCNFECGTVWTAQSTGAPVPIYAFKGAIDGEEPLGYPVMDAKGALYGTTSGGGQKYPPWWGLVYKLTYAKKAWVKTDVHVFNGNDGDGPQQLVLLGNKLVGTSASGTGAGNCCGNVFEMNTDGSAFSVIHTFTTRRSNQGETPAFGPLAYDARTGALYGETRFGGHFDSFACVQGCGVLFKLTPQGAGYTYSVLYTFKYLDDGGLPNGGLTLIDDGTTATMYGNAATGGIHNCGTSLPVGCGTVFSYADPGGFATIYEFKGPQPEYSDAVTPENSLAYVSGRLYGTSNAGGVPLGSGQKYGTIFSVDIKAKTDTVLHTFSSYPKDGGVPYGGPTLVKTKRGLVLYGTTFQGGSNKACPVHAPTPTGCGTIWRYQLP
jgi:uncharacterized repeat protein (TIGR03803 family)